MLFALLQHLEAAQLFGGGAQEERRHSGETGVIARRRSCFGHERSRCCGLVGRSGAARGGACALDRTSGRRRSRVAFGCHGKVSDGRDTAVDGEMDGAADRARGADCGRRDLAGHDPTDAGGGGGGRDRWVIAGGNCSIARGIGATLAISGPSDGAWHRLNEGGRS